MHNRYWSHGTEDCGDRDSDGFFKYGRGTDRGLINQGRYRRLSPNASFAV